MDSVILARHVPRLLLAAAILVAAGLSADAQPDILLSRPTLDFRMDSSDQFATVYVTRSGEGIVAWNTRYRSADGLVNRLAVASLSGGSTSWLSSPEDRPFDTVIVLPGHGGYVAFWPDSAGGTRSMRGRLIDDGGSPISDPFTLGPYRSVGFAGTVPAPDIPGVVVVWSTDTGSTGISYLRLIDDAGPAGPLLEYSGRVTTVDWVTSYLGDNRLVRVTSRLHLKIAPDGSVEPIRSVQNIPAHAFFGSDGEVLYVDRGTLYSLAALTDSMPTNAWPIPRELTPLPVAGRYKGAAFVVVDSTWGVYLKPPTQYHTSGFEYHTRLTRYFPERAPDDSAEMSLFRDGYIASPLPGHSGLESRTTWEYSSDARCDQHHMVHVVETFMPHSGADYKDYEIYHHTIWLTSAGRETSRPACDTAFGSVAYVSDSATAAVEVDLGSETYRPDGVPIAPNEYPQSGVAAGLALLGNEIVAVWRDAAHQVNRVHYLDGTMREHYVDSTREGGDFRLSGTAVTYRFKRARLPWEVDTLRFVIPTILGLRPVEFEFDWTANHALAVTRIVRGTVHAESERLMILLGGSKTKPLTAAIFDTKYGTFYLQELTDRTIEDTWLLGWRDSVLRIGDADEILEIDPSGNVVEIGRVPAPQHEITYWAELETGRSIRIQRLPDSLWRLERLNHHDATDYASIDLDIAEVPIVRAVGDDGRLALLWGSDSGVRLSLLDRDLRPLDNSLDPAGGGVRVSASNAPAELPYAVVDEKGLIVMWSTADIDSQVYIRRVALPLVSGVPDDTPRGDPSAPQFEISVRPNPPSRGGPISLELVFPEDSPQRDGPITVEIFNAAGQLVRHTRIDDVRLLAEPILLATDGWASGRYFVKVSAGGGSKGASILYIPE